MENINNPQNDDKHLVITWNHDKSKFQVSTVGETTLVEAVGLLEMAKLELLSKQPNKEELDNEKE